MHYWSYNEKRRHGTSDFPIELYHVDETHPRYAMPLHWHVETEWILILSGYMKFTINEEDYIAHKGDVIYIRDGVIHGGIPENCIYECLVFNMNTLLMHTDTCRKYMKKLLSHELLIFPLFPNSGENFHTAICDLFSTMRLKKNGWELTALGQLYQVFGAIFQKKLYSENPSPEDSAQKKMEPLKAVLEYIEQHYFDPITLENLAHTAGMSQTYFCRYFRTATGQTPMEYLNYYRIERACYQFATSTLTATEIAFNCGFHDSSYFIRTFKKYKGMTPKEYCKRI